MAYYLTIYHIVWHSFILDDIALQLDWLIDNDTMYWSQGIASHGPSPSQWGTRWRCKNREAWWLYRHSINLVPVALACFGCIYIYIYIPRERERDRERQREIDKDRERQRETERERETDSTTRMYCTYTCTYMYIYIYMYRERQHKMVPHILVTRRHRWHLPTQTLHLCPKASMVASLSHEAPLVEHPDCDMIFRVLCQPSFLLCAASDTYCSNSLSEHPPSGPFNWGWI